MNDYDGKVVIGTELDTKSVDAQVTKLEKDLETMVKALETDMKIPVELRMNKDERIKLENDIEKTKNRIISLKESMQDVGNEADKTTVKISKGFKKGTTTLKRFALSLFGIHSLYRLVSRASSAYLSQDTELAQKLQNVWVGLGLFLEPLLNSLSNILLKGLGYLNVFIKALTGVDYIARANAKALEKQTKAQKDLNKATQDYDFDVVRRQQDLSSKGAAGSTDFSGIEIPELDDRLVKKLQDLAKWLKENENLVKAVGIALGATFGAIAIAKLLSNIGSLIGSAKAGTGLAGLSGILKVLGTIGVISISVALLYSALTGRDLIEDLKEIKKGIEDLDDARNDSVEKTKEQAQSLKEAAEKSGEAISKMTNEDLAGFIKQVDVATSSTEDLIKNYKTQNEVLDYNSKEYQANAEKVNENIGKLDSYKQMLENVRTRLENENKDLDINSDKYKENQELLDKVNGSLNKINGYKATATAYINMESNTDNFFTNLWKQLKGGFKAIGESFDFSFGKKQGGGGFRGYALGGIVTQPTRALIGEAGYPEAVVPMTQDYLSTLASEIGKYSGGNKGGVTNVYLDGRLIQRQVQNVQNDKDFVGNI